MKGADYADLSKEAWEKKGKKSNGKVGVSMERKLYYYHHYRQKFLCKNESDPDVPR